MLFRMIQISENSRKLTEEYKQKRRMIPWNAMYGMRNRIVHDYGNVDLKVVYDFKRWDKDIWITLKMTAINNNTIS